jgi:hypothetical protein
LSYASTHMPAPARTTIRPTHILIIIVNNLYLV